jgi:PAT family beta-lactamase induction signal transducer AmpG
VGLVLSIFALSRLSPDGKNLCFDNACLVFVPPILQMAVVAGLISLFSATQDIVLDAFRVELCSKDDQHEVAGAAMYILGYRLGLIISSAGAIGLAAYISWNTVYFICSLFVLVGIIAVLLAHEPLEADVIKEKKEQGVVYRAIIVPFIQFMQKPYWLVALLLIFFYRLSDSYFGLMAYPFYAEIGFNKEEIAYITKLYGMTATIIGGIWGGCLLAKMGLMRGMLVFSLMQGITTAFYIPLYYIGHNVWALIATISLENVSSGIATTAIIAFMSVLCDKKYTATQYALLSSLTGFARDVFSSTAGIVLDATSWPIFFLISSLLTLPGFGLCWFLYKKKVDYSRVPIDT